MRRLRTAWPAVALLVVSLLLRGQGPPVANASNAPAPRTASASPDSAGVNKFMWYATSTQTVYVDVSAALGSHNGGMNFNGGSGGSATITVPLGWKVRMKFVNLDAIPHSMIIIANQQPLPAIPQTAAFGAAYTRDLTAGLFTAQGDDVNFTATAAGKYLMVCGVPGHAPSGMWIWFVVSADAKAPTYGM